MFAQHTCSYFIPRDVCPTPTLNAHYFINDTRLMFIGAHHTGTTAYINELKRMSAHFKDEDRVIHSPMQNMFWSSNSDKLWEGDAYADCPVYPQWSTKYEFGHLLHPDLRTLFNCFPNSLFVINSRPLQSYLRTKVSWEMRSPSRLMGKTSPMCDEKLRSNSVNVINSSNISSNEPVLSLMSSKFVTKVCEVTLSREKLHKAYIDFIIQNTETRPHRFIITDLELEGSKQVMYRICQFSVTSVSSDPMRKQRLEEGCLELKEMKQVALGKRQNHKTDYSQGSCELNSIRHVLLQHDKMPSLPPVCDELPIFEDPDVIATSSIFTFPEYVHNVQYQEIVTKLSSTFSHAGET